MKGTLICHECPSLVWVFASFLWKSFCAIGLVHMEYHSISLNVKMIKEKSCSRPLFQKNLRMHLQINYKPTYLQYHIQYHCKTLYNCERNTVVPMDWYMCQSSYTGIGY